MKFITDLLTQNDNTTHCVVRWAAAMGTLNGIGLSVYDVVVQHAHFGLQDYGIGLGATLGALGAALKLKPDVEPK